MGSEWKVRLLGDLCTEITVGFVGSMTQEYVESGVPFLRSKNIAEYNVDWNDMKFVSNEFHQKLSKSSLKAGDVAIVRTGKPGTTCVIPESIKEANCSDIVIARANKEILNPHYLAYFMNAMAHGQVNAHVVGAVQQHFNVGSAKKIEIPLPALEQQNKIVDVLKALDDKHRVNNQINQTLEQMAQTLFKSWFVDFDPVIDNALDVGNPIPEVFETRVDLRKAVRESAGFKPLPDDVRQLFPSQFEESELGWVPKGWGSETFNDIFDIASSKRVFAKDYVDSGVPFYRGKEITELSQGKAVNTEIFISEEKYQELKDKSGAPKAGDILITSVGTIGNTYLVREGDKFYFKDGNLTWIRGYKKERIPFFIKEWFKTSQAKDAIERVKIGTTQQAITIKALNKIVVLLPSTKILSFYENYLSNTYSKHSANLDENAYLEKLRDTLLPKLISGELRLDSPEVEQAKALVN